MKWNELLTIIKYKGGECLSKGPIPSTGKIRLQCSNGHIWEAYNYAIRRGTWCPTCNQNKRKLTIEEMQMIAASHGGNCLSLKYINSQTKLLWQCKEGHVWEAKPYHIKRGSWCPTCAKDNHLAILAKKAGFKVTIEDMRILAKDKGGLCLSENYLGGRVKLKWRCKNGHEWRTTPEIIKAGHWCPHCVGKAPYTIEHMKEFAVKRGGRCLSSKYINSRTKLEWECSEGHKWKSASHDILSGTWCPDCYKFYSEEKCRYIFQNLFGKDFKKDRIALNGYELDGYNSDLKLAFEYHGIQHYEYVPYFHSKDSNLLNRRQYDDQKKHQMCKDRGIHLVVIPYNVYKNDDQLLTFIITSLEKLGIQPPIDSTSFSFETFYNGSQVLRQLQELAQLKGGRLISNEYTNDKSNLQWICGDGHVWWAKPNNIKNGSWCPVCTGLMKKNIEQMHLLAGERGGKCLSTEYINNKTHLNWQCDEGHIWKARPDSIVNGTWCPTCAGKLSLNIEDMIKIAEERGGKCLSKKYVNEQTKLLWECSKGHKWRTTPSLIRQGAWCRTCSGSAKLNIGVMKELAQSRGGKCLSNEYKNNKGMLLWECVHGHRWEASANRVKSKGSWCPECAKDKYRQPKRKLSIDDMISITLSRGRQCLSETCVSGNTKLDWECKFGHRWSATPESVKNAGSWCPYCARNSKKSSFRLQ